MPFVAHSRQAAPVSSLTWRRVLAVFCVFLILLVGAADLLHTHPAGSASEAGCSLCAVAHLTVMAAPFVGRPVVLATSRMAVLTARCIASVQAVSGPFCIRPPPAHLIAHA